MSEYEEEVIVYAEPEKVHKQRNDAHKNLRADPAIVVSLQRSVAAAQKHEIASQMSRECRHTYLEQWHGAPQPFHCKACKDAVTDFARVEKEEKEAQKAGPVPKPNHPLTKLYITSPSP